MTGMAPRSCSRRGQTCDPTVIRRAGSSSLVLAAGAGGPWLPRAPRRQRHRLLSRSCRIWTSTRRAGSDTGDFAKASGPAVDQGLICEFGTVEDTRLIFAPSRVPPAGSRSPVRKTTTCDDGSGRSSSRSRSTSISPPRPRRSAGVVLGGTGDYRISKAGDRARPSATAPSRRPQRGTTTPASSSASGLHRSPGVRRPHSAVRDSMKAKGPRSSVDRAQPS